MERSGGSEEGINVRKSYILDGGIYKMLKFPFCYLELAGIGWPLINLRPERRRYLKR